MSSTQAPARSPLPFAALYVLCLLLAGNFLMFDLLRRLSGGLEPRSAAVLLGNLLIVWGLSCSLCLLVAAVLSALERARAGSSQPLLVFAFYSINLTFGKYWASGWFEPLSARSRMTVSLIALLMVIPFGLAARDSLGLLRDTVVAHGRRLALWLSLPCIGVLFLAFQSEPPAPSEGSGPKMPDILLLTIDTLSASDMSLYGYARPTTPSLDKFAQKGAIVFDRSHSTSNLTETALCAYEGFYARSRQNDSTLLSLLRRAGYRDNLFISFNTPEFFGLQRTDHVRVVSASEGSALYRTLARALAKENLAWLALLTNEDWIYFCPYDWRVGAEYHRYWKTEHFSEEIAYQAAFDHLSRPRQSPTFVWAHLWQPHYPYLPGPAYKGRFGSHELPYPPVAGTKYSPGLQPVVEDLRKSYDEYILDLDAGLGDFLEKLEKSGVLNHTILIIGSDHGEQFERGYAGHAGDSLSEPMIHIPLLMRFPEKPQAARVASFVSPVDVAPTLLSHLGLEVPSVLPGEPLQPYLADPKKLSLRPKLSISYSAYDEGAGEVAVFSDRFKVVFRRENPNQVRVYDLIADGQETTDISARFGDALRTVVESVKWPSSNAPGGKTSP